MNLTISKEQMIAGLQAVQNVVSTRTTLPILSNVLLRAEGSHLEITATDLDVTVACKVEAKSHPTRRHDPAREKTVWHRARIERGNRN
jgi:DNA polymerase III sliding clamp (beta) subunit (PCNA family)